MKKNQKNIGLIDAKQHMITDFFSFLVIFFAIRNIAKMRFM